MSHLSCVTPITWIHLPQMNHSSSWTTHHLEPLIILNTHHFEYEIFWTRITRITRIIFCTWNYLREDAHGSHESHGSLFAAVRSHEERIARIFLFRTRISRICQCFAWLTDIFFNLSFKPQRVNNHNELSFTTSRRLKIRDPCAKKYSCYPRYSCSKNLVFKHQELRVRSVCQKIFVLFGLFVFKKISCKKISCSKCRRQNPRSVCQKPRVRKPRVPKRFVLFVRFVFKKSRVKKISCSNPRVPKSRTHHVSNPKCHR